MASLARAAPLLCIRRRPWLRTSKLALDNLLFKVPRASQMKTRARSFTFETEVGPRYIRVVKNAIGAGGRAAHCFVDKSNGDVLKTGGWKGPAKTKQARGNIFDASNGLANVEAHGLRDLPAHLR